jgi:cytochrome c biogenesis protein CcdA
MRSLIIAGVILIAVGLFVILKPPSYSREESVLKFGDLEARVQQQRTVPGWVGGVLLGAGCVLVVFGGRKTR